MKYQNILRALPLLSLMALGTTSCTFEQEDYFDESASLRLTHLNANLKSRLVAQSDGANHGWVIQYYVAGTDEMDFEGFNLFGKFYGNGKVNLASDHRYLRNGKAGTYTESMSTFDMLAEEGPVLAFNTWNDILTVFADPVDPTKAPGVLNSDGEGMNGDYNLVLKSFANNEIVFHGERHRAVARFIPCDRPWQQYINDVKTLKNSIANSSLTDYYVTNGSDTMYFSGLNKGVFVYGERVFDPLKRKVLNCVFTPQGFRIQHEDTLASTPFQEFVLSEAKDALHSLDGKVRVIPCWDTYMASHNTLWEMDANVFSAEQKSLLAQLSTEIAKASSSYSIKSIGFGKSSGGESVNGIVVTFYTNTAKTKTNTVGMEMGQKRVAYGQIEFTLADAPKVDKNMTAINNKATNLTSLVKQFASTVKGRYSVVPNDYFLPTGGTYTPVAGGTTFTLK